MSTLIALKREIEGLEADSGAVNALRIRDFLRQDPDVLCGNDSFDLRMRIWSALLLGYGIDHVSLKSDVSREKDGSSLPNCREQHVLLNDVSRTRADVPMFRSPNVTSTLQYILQKFCLDQRIEYKQGMNEVLAPFIYLCGSQSEPRLELCCRMFEAMVVRYVERFYCVDSSFFLFQTFRMFQLLLKYHSPQLGLFLDSHEFVPELYSPSWLLTLYSRTLPIDMVLGVWDVLLSVDDPAFSVFFGLGLLIMKKDTILKAESGLIPEVISTATFRSSEEFKKVVEISLQLYRNTPRCFLRLLRLCFVACSDLSPCPAAINRRRQEEQMLQQEEAESVERANAIAAEAMKQEGEEVDDYMNSVNALLDTAASALLPKADQQHHTSSKLQLNYLDLALVQQSARHCVMLSAQELISILLPGKTDQASPDYTTFDSQIVLLDARSHEEIKLSGAGILPKAISLEPRFLEHPAAFHAWLEHFDATRGCRICIFDMGLSSTEGSESSSEDLGLGGLSLWRRLLLGEGDGDFASGVDLGRVTSDKHLQNHLRGMYRTGTVSHGADDVACRDSDVDVRALSEKTARDDAKRPSVRLAQILQKEAFSQVSVLEGGYAALVDRIQKSRGRFEPVIINHDAARWSEYVAQTGGAMAAVSIPASMKVCRRFPLYVLCYHIFTLLFA